MHPASSFKTIRFKDMDGQNFIMYAQTSIWEPIVQGQMPHSKFFLQNDLEAVGELSKYSELPSFVTDITLNYMPKMHNNRINIPFKDEQATV
jgi:hypothetical protein